MVLQEQSPTKKPLTRKARQRAKNIRDEVMAAAQARLDLGAATAPHGPNNSADAKSTREEASTSADAKSTRVPGDEAADTATGSDAKATNGEDSSTDATGDEEFGSSDSEEEELIPVPHYQRLFGLNPSNLFEEKKEILLEDVANPDDQ